MNRRLVRIYKDPKGNGDYVNKTKAFLQKAQMGTETQSAPDVNKYLQYVYEQLSNDTTPEDIFAELISAGLNQDIAYKMLNSVVAQMVDAGELNPDNPVTKKDREEEIQLQEEQQQAQEQQQVQEEEVDPATDYFNSYADEPEYSQPEIEFEEGGEIIDYDDSNGAAMFNQYTTDNNLNNTDESDIQDSENADFDNKSSNVSKYGFLNEESQYPGLHDYYENFTPLSWEPVDTSIYRKGGSKKSFVKNVLNRLQEGGQEQALGVGQGNKFDTFTDDVSKKKQDFINTIKDKANKARLNETYDKMMKSNDPSLIQSAQTLSQNRNQSQQEEGQFFQTGGYVGEGQPDMFMYGGTELPFFEGDFLPEAQKGMIQKLGDFLLGEQYYTANNPYNVKTGSLYKDPVSGLTPVARTVHKRGILGRPKQWTDYYTKGSSKTENTKALTPGQEIKTAYEKQLADAKNKNTGEKHGMSKELWNSLPGEAKRDIRRGERRLNRELERGIEQEEKDILFNKGVHQYIDLDAEAAKEKLLQEARQKKLLEKNRERSEALSIEMGMHKPDWWNQVSVAPTLPEGLTLEDIEYLDAEKENADMLSTNEQQKAAEERLKLYKQDSRSNDNSVAKIKENAYDQFKNLIHFIPDNSMADYKEKRDREAEERRLVEERIMGQEFEKRYGGLPKAQVGVKSPTSGVSTASDPTANSGNLVGMLKPQENPNTFMGASKPFMNQNVPTNPEAAKVQTIEMDPNQTKDQPENDELIAQDVQRKRNIDGTDVVNKVNAGIDMFTGFMGRLDAAKKEKEMYKNNFTSDNLYGVSTNKDRGDYVAYGQQTGMFRPDQTGQETAGRFAYGQVGGYMQSGGYTEGDEVDMTEEELAEFIANGGEVEYL